MRAIAGVPRRRIARLAGGARPALATVVTDHLSIRRVAPGVYAVVIRAILDEDDLGPLERAAARSGPGACDVIVDARGLRGLGPAAHDRLRTRMPAIAPRIRRCAVVHGGGLLGAVMCGLALELAHARPFRDPRPAVSWLGHPPALSNELDRRCGDVPMLSQLRGWLVRQPWSRLDDAGRAMGVSARSLQRRLASVDTTYRDELRRARARMP
jgi:hypothetical protein